ncbi:MAG TPA: restriction endonuclease subunit S [Gaiellaceae bacterium]
MSEWSDVSLDELAAMTSGKPIKPGSAGPFVAFGSNGIIGGAPEARHDRGIIVGRVGAYCGSLAVSRAPFWASDNTIVLTPRKDSDLDYVYYLLLNADLNRHAGGAAQPLITQATLKGLTYRVPDESIRSKIGRALRTFDHLIEINRRRIAVLDEMAQAIYREWFVYFRYPGHEDDAIADSPLGPVPQGWELATVGQSFTTVLGGTPSRRNAAFWNGDIPWLNSSKTNELRVIDPSEFITALGLAKSSTKLMPAKTTLIAITGATLGQVSMLEAEMCANQSVVGVYGENGSGAEWIYRTFVDRIEGIVQSASGGAQQHINKGVVENVLIVRPPSRVLSSFNDAARPLGDEIATLLRSNRVLESIRDTVLPRLVTGAIDVSNLDLDVLLEESAA